MECDELKVDDRALIETAAGLIPVTVTGFEGEGYVYVRFDEGDTAIVRRDDIHRKAQ